MYRIFLYGGVSGEISSRLLSGSKVVIFLNFRKVRWINSYSCHFANRAGVIENFSFFEKETRKIKWDRLTLMVYQEFRNLWTGPLRTLARNTCCTAIVKWRRRLWITKTLFKYYRSKLDKKSRSFCQFVSIEMYPPYLRQFDVFRSNELERVRTTIFVSGRSWKRIRRIVKVGATFPHRCLINLKYLREQFCPECFDR